MKHFSLLFAKTICFIIMCNFVLVYHKNPNKIHCDWTMTKCGSSSLEFTAFCKCKPKCIVLLIWCIFLIKTYHRLIIHWSGNEHMQNRSFFFILFFIFTSAYHGFGNGKQFRRTSNIASASYPFHASCAPVNFENQLLTLAVPTVRWDFCHSHKSCFLVNHCRRQQMQREANNQLFTQPTQ